MDGWGSQAWNAAACHPLHSVSAVWSGASQLLGWLPSSSMHRCAAICNFSCISSEFHFGCMFCSLGWGQFGKIVFQLLRCGLRHVMWKLSSWLPAWADLGTLTWELCMGTCKVHWTSSWHGIITDFSFLRKLSICHNWCFLSLGVKSNCSWGLLPCMQNNWFCNSTEKFKRIASGIRTDFNGVYPPAGLWKLGPCQMHFFPSKILNFTKSHRLPF